MRTYENWIPYQGASSIVLAVVLIVVAGALSYLASRLKHPIEFKRPGTTLGFLIVVIWVLSLMTFLVAVTVYARELLAQVGPYTGPANPITPVTGSLGVVAFVAIVFLTRHAGFWVALGSAIVGAIAAPMIFELPFDLIVMWRTFPPAPATLFTLLFFLPLFLIEVSSFAMLLLSPVVRLSRLTLFLLAGMFLLFAVWALFGFAYPAAPIPTALNMLTKALAFAAAVSLFVPERNLARFITFARDVESARAQAPQSSGLM